MVMRTDSPTVAMSTQQAGTTTVVHKRLRASSVLLMNLRRMVRISLYCQAAPNTRFANKMILWTGLWTTQLASANPTQLLLRY